jgi:nucleotide-binding universal stress UspA family protein
MEPRTHSSSPDRYGGPVVVAVGDAETHDPSLQHACAEARRTGRPLHLVHVLTQRPTTAAERLLHDVAGQVHALVHGSLRVETVIRTGQVVPVLNELSRDAGLVVLQRRQLSRLQRLVSGSVSAQVAGQAHAPTVSVPEGWQPRGGGRPHVTVGLDGADDDEGTRLLRHAFARAAELEAELTVVHGWQLPSGYDDASVDETAVDDWRTRYLQVLHRRLVPLTETHPTVTAAVEIRHLHPADALIQAAKDSDLVVLGRGRLEHPLVSHLGSVARAVIRDAACPVEVVNDH